MSWLLAGYVLLLFLGAAVLPGLAAFVWRQRNRMASMQALAGWLMVLAVWCAFQLLFMISPEPASQWFWLRARQTVSVLQAPTSLRAALYFSGRGRWVTSRLVALLACEVLLTWGVFATTDLHGLWWRSVAPNLTAPYPPLVVTPGPWASLRLLYANIVSAGAVLLLLMSLRGSSPTYRRQIALIVLSSILPWTGALLNPTVFNPLPGVDLTPAGYGAMALVWGAAVLRLQLFEIVPVARAAVFEDMQDAVLVTHMDGRVVDANPAALLLLGRTSANCLGRPTVEVLAPWPELLACLRAGAGQTELLLNAGPDGRSFEFRIAPWHNAQDQPVGWLVLGRDVTERRKAQDLDLLNTVKAETNRPLSVAEVIQSLRRVLGETLGMPAGWIFLYDDTNDDLLLQTSWGMPEPLTESYRICPVPAFTCPAAVWEQQSIVHSNIPTHSAPLVWRQAVCVPLTAEGEFQGVMELYSATAGAFPDHRTALFTQMGQDVGAALRNARRYEEMDASRSELQRLSQMLVDVQESERQHIASELHDEIGQSLTALRLLIGRARLAQGEQRSLPLNEADAVTQDLIHKVREMSLDLRPAMLDDLGLQPALLWQIDRYTAQTGIRVAFRTAGVERRFSPRVEITAYRIIQEALTNVARHAGVTEAAVQLWVDGRNLVIQVIAVELPLRQPQPTAPLR
ncbi:MAG: PAS domain-containing protein [Chloroflexi bacterium]|nr:PAS domain-containing protein [Chloroflexota bacterium]